MKTPAAALRAIVLAFGTAFAVPTESMDKRACTPGTYICSGDLATMEVCDFDGYYKVRLVPLTIDLPCAQH